MGFIETLCAVCGVNENLTPIDYKCVIFGGKSVYLEGVREVVAFSTDEIVLRLRKGMVKLKGVNLEIIRFCDGDLAVSGEVTSVALTER